jgi:hypothetical protein
MYSIAIFQEAQKYCRWKKVLDNILKDINLINLLIKIE